MRDMHMKSRQFFFFNDTAPAEISPLSLHDALPISPSCGPPTTRSAAATSPPSSPCSRPTSSGTPPTRCPTPPDRKSTRLNLQSRQYLVCRLLLEKKKYKPPYPSPSTTHYYDHTSSL